VLKSANFGLTKANATGSSGVGYALFDSTGQIVLERTTSGVNQVVPGVYSADVEVPSMFSGQIIWDTGSAFSRVYYATEEVSEASSVVQTLSSISGTLSTMSNTLQFIRDMTAGRWKIEGNQMKFYAEDNVTLVAVFDLKDDLGAPSTDSVFERVKV
jgi:hypothetical protein